MCYSVLPLMCTCAVSQLCLQRLSRHQESLQYFQEHLRSNPGDVLAMLQVGTEYWYLQDYHQR